MQRIQNGTQVGAPPTLDAPSGTPGYFASSVHGGPTRISQDWLNNIQEEIIAVIAAASIALNAGSQTQLRDAINTLIANASSPFLTDSGAANAYVLTPAPAIGGYTAGQSFTFKAANANTGASTVNISAKGAAPIVHRDGSPLQAGDIPAGSVCRVTTPDGANFQLEDMIPTLATTALEGLVALATNAEALAMTSTTKALTPSNLASLFSSNLASPGWAKLPGGLIVQWLRVSRSISGEGEQTAILPITFPNAQLMALGNSLNSSLSSVEDLWVQTTADGDVSHVAFFLQGTSSSPGTIQGFDAIVLGF